VFLFILLLVLWKVFHWRLPTDQHIQHKGLHICFMCTLCEKQEESIQYLFFECPTTLRIWSLALQLFLNSHFSNVTDLLYFIKSDGSSLVNLIKLVVITFSIWMIWRLRNYYRFQVKNFSRAIYTIKDFSLVGNLSKSSTRNDMFDFNVLKFFDINTHSGKVLHPHPLQLLIWEDLLRLERVTCPSMSVEFLGLKLAPWLPIYSTINTSVSPLINEIWIDNEMMPKLLAHLSSNSHSQVCTSISVLLESS